jgi:hypothetical protein
LEAISAVSSRILIQIVIAPSGWHFLSLFNFFFSLVINFAVLKATTNWLAMNILGQGIKSTREKTEISEHQNKISEISASVNCYSRNFWKIFKKSAQS